MIDKKEVEYLEEGQTVMGQMIGIVAVVVVAVMFIVFGTAIAGQTFVQVQPQIADITDANVSAAITSANTNAFETLDLTAGYMPILVLAVIGGLALGAILSFLVVTQGAGSGGTAF